MKYSVYVLKSKKDGKYYTGITNNLQRRIMEHNRDNHSTPSTKNRGPLVLIYHEEVADSKLARLREKYLKTGIGRDFIRKKVVSPQL